MLYKARLAIFLCRLLSCFLRNNSITEVVLKIFLWQLLPLLRKSAIGMNATVTASTTRSKNAIILLGLEVCPKCGVGREGGVRHMRGMVMLVLLLLKLLLGA